MTEPRLLTADSPILSELNFKPYRSSVVRKVKPFLPLPTEPQTIDVKTPWSSCQDRARDPDPCAG